MFISLLARGEGRGKKRERNITVQEKHLLAASRPRPDWDLAHNPGMCPDRESNRQPLSSQASAQPTKQTSQAMNKVFKTSNIRTF